MTDILQQITENNGIIVGGVARYLMGYEETYTKKWIDIVINESDKSNIKDMGLYLPIEGTTFPSPVTEQFIVKLDSGYILDVFVRDTTDVKTKVLEGIIIQSEDGDIEYHEDLLSKVNNQYCEEKITKIKTIYNR